MGGWKSDFSFAQVRWNFFLAATWKFWQIGMIKTLKNLRSRDFTTAKSLFACFVFQVVYQRKNKFFSNFLFQLQRSISKTIILFELSLQQAPIVTSTVVSGAFGNSFKDRNH